MVFPVAPGLLKAEATTPVPFKGSASDKVESPITKALIGRAGVPSTPAVRVTLLRTMATVPVPPVVRTMLLLEYRVALVRFSAPFAGPAPEPRRLRVMPPVPAMSTPFVLTFSTPTAVSLAFASVPARAMMVASTVPLSKLNVAASIALVPAKLLL